MDLHTLSPHLKQLRLSGILETLEVRHQQAIAEQWSHIEFLERLLQDEVERRGQKQLTLRLRRAAFQPEKTVERLNGGRADGTYERRLLGYIRPDLLIIDDFGLKALRSPGPEDFYDVISERYEHGATIVTSNRALDEWPQLFGDPLLASAGLDRLFHNAHALVITGPSFRTRGRRVEVSGAPA